MDGLFSIEKPLKEKAEEFVRDWKSRLGEKEANQEINLNQTLWNDLSDLILGSHGGLKFEYPTASGGRIDVFSKECSFIVEQKSKEKDLDNSDPRREKKVTPFEQAVGYNNDLPAGDKVSTIVTSNFEKFRFYDLRTKEGLEGEKYEECTLEEIPNKIELFIELFHGQAPEKQYSILDASNTEKAADKISGLYSMLSEEIKSLPVSQEVKEEYKSQIPLIVMRMVFLLFADNTSDDRGKIFKNHQFRTFLEKSTDEKHFTRDFLDLFRCLNIPETDADARFRVMEEVRDFPYVDGGLFEKVIDSFQFPKDTWKELLDLVSDFKYWDRINISVFGPIMDRVFAGEYRRKNGIYYTSKENIQKVINPLFMDDLRHELEEIKKTKDFEKQRSDLDAFHGKLSCLQFFDPACGSGNFLTETYMELRALEDEVIGLESYTSHNLNNEIKVSLSQFHGIELNPYAVTVARTALQIASEEALERSYARFSDLQSVPLSFLPLKDELKGIVCGNALTMDWGDLALTPSKDLFIFGNPPFKGKKSKEQQEELENIFAPYPAGKLDYCAAWLYKAATFLKGSGATFAFVSTNSIVEGEQVVPLFQPLRHMGWKISFAYPPFEWDHKKDAKVTVVIIGFSQSMTTYPILYQMYEVENGIKSKNGKKKKEKKWEGQPVKNISPYLSDGPDILVPPVTEKPIAGDLPKCLKGNEPDSKSLILQNKAEYIEAEEDPIAAKYVKKYLGADELIKNKERWCLWLVDSDPKDRRESKFLRERIEATKKARKNKKIAQTPWLFGSRRQPDTVYLAIPRHFSENRDYFTTSYEPKDVIASDALFTIEDPDGFAFSVIETSMFMTWQNWIGGRLEMRKRFSNTLVWNTFPLPSLTKEQKDLIIEGGREVLEARANYPFSSLADLYDPDNMPQDLRKAHEALDRAMDRVFSDKPFNSEEERQKALLKAYEKMTGEEAGEQGNV